MDQQKRQRKPKLRQINIAVLGPQRQGKTSLVEWLTGKSYAKVQDNQEENYQSTLNRTHHYFYHMRNHINIFDLPGASFSSKTQVKGMLGIQTILFVVAADQRFENSETEIKGLLRLCDYHNVKKILFAINFMDAFPLPNWNQNRYEFVKSKLTDFTSKYIQNKKEPVEISFAPTGGLYGENIHLNNEKLNLVVNHGVAKWIPENNVQTLLQCLEQNIISKGKTKTFKENKETLKKKPLRLTVIGVIPAKAVDDEDLQFMQDSQFQDVDGVFAYINSGKLRRKAKLIFQPSETFAIVKSVDYFTENQMKQYQKLKHVFDQQLELQGKEIDSYEQMQHLPKHASPGSFCYITFYNRERIRIPVGAIGGIPIFKQIPQLVSFYTCKFKIVNQQYTKTIGYKTQLTGLYGINEITTQISEVQCELNTKYGKINLHESSFNYSSSSKQYLVPNNVYQVRLQIMNGEATVDPFQVIPSCGKIFFFVQNTFVAIGVVEEITLLHNNIDYLPRLFAVPDVQVTDAITQKKTDHWANCNICFQEPINCILIPCGHMKLCFSCSKRIHKCCPFCKLEITKVDKMQVISLENEIELMSFANCDSCVTKRFTHSIMGCNDSKYLCDDCVDRVCKICGAKDHLISRIYI